MVGKKKKNEPSLGRSLRNDKFGSKGEVSSDGRFIALHTTDMDSKVVMAKKMQSVTQMTDFEEFYYNASLADKEFTAEKQNAVIITSTSFQTKIDEPSEEQIRAEREHWNSLKIPRRPHWDRNTTAEKLHEMESQSFLEWRRDLVKLEENKHLLLSPFEKNLEVWRQLWRVCERCDLIVQIVDARNPLLFRCPDLEKYVKELNPNKSNLLLLNKADLLTEEQRLAWGTFFKENNLEFIYFSASNEQLKMKLLLSEQTQLLQDSLNEFEELELHEMMLAQKFGKNLDEDIDESEDDKSEDDSDDKKEKILEFKQDFKDEILEKEKHTKQSDTQHPLTKIYTREELLVFFPRTLHIFGKWAFCGINETSNRYSWVS